MAEANKETTKRKATDDDEYVNPESEINKRLRAETDGILKVGRELRRQVTAEEKKIEDATSVAAASAAEASIKKAEKEADEQIPAIVDRILSTKRDSESDTEGMDQTVKKHKADISTNQVSNSINELVRTPVTMQKLVRIPVAQQYQTEMNKFHARKKARELNEFADNLEKHQQSIIDAAIDIAQYKPIVSEDGIKLPEVLKTLVSAKQQVLNQPILKKSPLVTKLLLNIIDLHNGKNTPIEIQNKCQQLGALIIEAPSTTFSIPEKVQLTDFVLMLRNTMSLMSDKSIPVIQRYVQSIRHTPEYEDYSRAEQRAIDVLAPTFRCCSAFTNCITNIPTKISESKPYKVAKKAVSWGFNPLFVATIGSWFNQAAVIDSVRDNKVLPEVYPTDYLLFKLAFTLSILVFGSSIYFYYQKKFREEEPALPVAAKSDPGSSYNSEQLSNEPGSANVPEDHPFRHDKDIQDFSYFLQDVRQKYFPTIEERSEEYKESIENINQFGSMKLRVENAVSGNGELTEDFKKIVSKQKAQINNLRNLGNLEQPAITYSTKVISQHRSRQINLADPKNAEIRQSILDKSAQLAPRPKGAVAAAEPPSAKLLIDGILEETDKTDKNDKNDETDRDKGEFNFDKFGRAAKKAVEEDAAAAAKNNRTPDPNGPDGAPGTSKSNFRRIRKSKNKSPRKRKSVRKSVKKSPRKSVRKSVKKSLRKPLKKSVRKSLRKPLKKSVRKSVKKSLRKPLKKSVRKSVKKSVRKSLRKPLKKSLRKSLKKSTRKNKQMKKSR